MNIGVTAKRRIITLSITFGLFLLYVGIGSLAIYGYIPEYPRYTRAMLVVTMIYVMGGCILQTVGLTKVVAWLGSICFIAVCICLFYAKHWYDFVVFILCIFLILRRSTNLCDQLCDITESKK